MSRNQVLFYATARDLTPVMSSLEERKNIQYTLTGLFKVRKLQTYLSYVDIPDFGQASHPTAVANPTYLVSLRGTVLRIREVPQDSGGLRYALDQRLNEDTIAFSPGGRYGKDVILYGTVGTVSTSITSKALYDLFAMFIRESFERRREFFVGSEALDLSKAGIRLTIGAFTPPEFDLRP